MLLRTSTISFPGLGIGEFEIDSVAFSFGSFQVAWYGLIITIGMFLAVCYVIWRAKQCGIGAEHILDFAIFTILFGVLGARLYYVISEIDSYDSLGDVFKIWEGGLAIYGGIIAGGITVFVMCRIKKINFLQMADFVCPAVLIGQILGRWGNFANGEAFGAVTDLPWRMGVNNFLTGFTTLYVHPTFLYESLWNLLGFVLANVFYKRKQYNGQIFYFCFAWYGLGRMMIEYLRSDSLYLGQAFGWPQVWYLKVSLLLGLACFLFFGGLLIYHFVKGLLNRKEDTKHVSN